MSPDKRKKIAQIYPELAPKLQMETTAELINNLATETEHSLRNITKTVANLKLEKGDKGDTPVAGIDFPFPKNGIDYVLTETDKKEIAQKVEVPIVEKIVEKTEVIREQPLVTEKIIEVAVTDEPIKIADKLNTLKDVIEPHVIKGYENSDAVIKKIKEQKLEMRDIKNMPLNMNDLRWHGSGIPSLTAGTNITLTPTSDGGFTISSTGVATSPGGVDTNVQFNDAGAFGGDSGFTFNKTTDTINVAGNVEAVGLLFSKSALALEETGVGTDIITIQAPASIVSGYTLTLPIDDGTASQFLQTDGSGVLTWASAQPLDATLTALAGLTIVAQSLIVGTGTDAFAVLPPPAFPGYLLGYDGISIVWQLQSSPAAPTWNSVLGTGRTSGGVNPQLTTTDHLEFRDANKYIFSSATTVLDIVGDGIINLTPTTSTNTAKPIVSTLATGTAPFTIASTTKVTNLNVDLLDGRDESEFALLAGRSGGQILIGGTGTTDDSTLQSTSGVGATGAEIYFKVGNNGATEVARIQNDGKMVFGGNAASTNGSTIQMRSNATQGIYIEVAAAAGQPLNSYVRSRGTIASPSAVASGDLVLNFNAGGWDGGARVNTMMMQSIVDGAVSSGVVPQRAVFFTGTTNTALERLRITSAGLVGIGTILSEVVPTATLHIQAHNDTENVSKFAGYQDSDIPTVYSGLLAQFGVYDVWSSGGGTPSFAAYTTIGATGKITKYESVDTNGKGVPAIYKVGRATAQVAANASVVTFTPTADGTFLVSANVLVTTATVHNFTATIAYTDEGNTARTVTMQFSTLAGAFVTAMTNAQGTVPYEGVPLHLRVKANTAITVATTGVFTSVVYNVEAVITQLV